MAASLPEDGEISEPPHDEFTCPAGVIVQIPWLPKRPKTVALKESEFYPRYFANRADDQTNRPGVLVIEESNRIKIQQTIAEAIPFFLPARYHSMDSAQLHKSAATPGSYWTNAIHFVRTCNDLGTAPYFNLSFELTASKPWLEGVTVKGTECKFQDFPEGVPEQCETAAEFLLEPWVLLQLPTQAALLHQWNIGVMAESLRFAKRLVEINNAGFTTTLLDSLNRMNQMCEQLYQHSCAGLSCFFNIFCNDVKAETLAAKSRFFQDAHPNFLSKTLVCLEFILGEECADIVNYIKRESWCRGHVPTDLEFDERTQDICARYADHTLVYTEKFWTMQHTSKPNLCGIGKADPAKLRKKDKESRSIEAILKKDPGYMNQTKKNLKKMKTFIKEEVLKESSPLKGLEDVDNFVKHLQEHLTPEAFAVFMHDLSQWEYLKGIDCGTAQVEKGGVLIEILSLEADVWAEDFRSNLIRTIWLAAEAYDKDVHLAADSIPSKRSYSAREIKNIFCKLASEREKRWSLKGVIGKAKSTCKPSDLEKGFQLSSSSAEAVQSHFTRRIRLLVLGACELHCKNKLKTSMLFHPECLIMQYILPCFVAMILDVEHDPKINSTTKIEYKQFVHELVKSYEENPFVQTLENGKRKRNYHGREDFQGFVNIQMKEVISSLATAFKDSPNMLKIVNKIQYFNSKCFVGALQVQFNAEFDYNVIDWMDSKFQLFWLCHRLKNCLVKVGWLPKKHVSFGDFLKPFNQLTDNKTTDMEGFLKLNLMDEIFNLGMWRSKVKVPSTTAEVVALLGSRELTTPQLCGITLFLAWKHKMGADRFFGTFPKPLFGLDPVQSAVAQFLNDDWWKLMLQMAPYLKGPQQEDLSLIPMDVVLKNACCLPLLAALNPGQERVVMRSPGEVTFCPIQHCRWCGLVNAQPFRLCPECQDEPDYPHLNYFCSEKCEKTALDKCHTEEHARFIMEKLGI